MLTATIYAQDDDADFADLRLWLIDRIEKAWADGDTETLQRMAEAEHENDVVDWIGCSGLDRKGSRRRQRPKTDGQQRRDKRYRLLELS